MCRITGGVQKGFKTVSNKWRWIDAFINGIAHEGKVGYVNATRFARNQIIKDVELRAARDVRGVVWHFFRSGITGKIGPSPELKKLLIEAGIKIKIHFFK